MFCDWAALRSGCHALLPAVVGCQDWLMLACLKGAILDDSHVRPKLTEISTAAVFLMS